MLFPCVLYALSLRKAEASSLTPGPGLTYPLYTNTYLINSYLIKPPNNLVNSQDTHQKTYENILSKPPKHSAHTRQHYQLKEDSSSTVHRGLCWIYTPPPHASQLLSQVTDSWLSDTCLLHAGREFASCSMLCKNSANAQVLEPQSRMGKTKASSSLLSPKEGGGPEMARQWHRGHMIC